MMKTLKRLYTQFLKKDLIEIYVFGSCYSCSFEVFSLIKKDISRFKPSQDFVLTNNCFMESLNKSKCSESSFWSSVFRTKSYSYSESYRKDKCKIFSALQDFDVQISSTFQKKITSESLGAYVIQLVGQIYEQDPIGTGKMIGEFLSHNISKLRQRITERLSLLKYVVDTLKYKPFAEVQRQILKQWKKNVIFFSINTIWATKMTAHKFTSLNQFTEEYKKQVSVIANLSHFYFKQALAILDGKNVVTFCYLQEDTSHKILNSLKDWKEIYKQALIPLIKRKNLSQNYVMQMHYNPKVLQINDQYLDLEIGQSYLAETIQKIRQMANQSVIHNKIEILKEIRSSFIREIQESRAKIAKRKRITKYSTLQKDDIIGCMIYCIISGQITEIQASLQSITELLGTNNQLFSRKGVDSYRADLQSAIEYLCQQSQLNGLNYRKLLEETQIKVQLANKSTNIQLSIFK